VNFGPIVFLATFFALAASWCGFVLAPQMQVGQLGQTNTVPPGATYPLARPGQAAQGAQVYRANGCVYCHSQQVTQTGTVCDVLVTDPGTNQAAAIAALIQLRPELHDGDVKALIANLPAHVLQGVTKEGADAATKLLNATSAKAQLLIVPTGPDIARGWGKRRSVAEDFLFDTPAMPGSQRVGPDLANVGARLPDANWHLRHLYAPRMDVKESTMPPYRFLFEKRKIEYRPSPDALVLPPELAPPAGYEIVPTPAARALVAYLLSLRSDAPIFSAPYTTLAAPANNGGTNAPAGQAATNAPAK
jgi:cytochrome c oxidase cbb3-type subunit 2